MASSATVLHHYSPRPSFSTNSSSSSSSSPSSSSSSSSFDQRRCFNWKFLCFSGKSFHFSISFFLTLQIDPTSIFLSIELKLSEPLCLLNWNLCLFWIVSILISRLIDSCLWFVWFILKKKLRVFSVHIDWFGGWVLKLIVMKMDRNAKIHNQTLSYWAIWFYLKVECWIKKGSSS